MKKSLTVGCVIMASGLSRRFGANKLLADFCGQPMLCRAFAATATPGIAARIVVTRSEDVQALCRTQGVPVLLHSLPGRNDTVRLGLSALLEQLPELSGCMFLPGDQPLLCRETVEAMTERFSSAASSPPRQNGKKKQNGRSSVWVPWPITTRHLLLEVPFCLEAASFQNCSPCRKIKAATCCLKSTLRRYARSVLQPLWSCWMRTPRRCCNSWKPLPG